LELVPNPTTGYFEVILPGFMNKNLSIELINPMGEVIYINNNINVNKLPINITEEPKGIYYVRIHNEKLLKVKKLIVQ